MTSLPVVPRSSDHVLVASPSSAVRQRVLESLRFPVRRVEQASAGAEALVQLEKGFWQVLFLDRRLPDLNAEELSQTIRQRFPGTQVVLLDSESDAESSAPKENAEVIPESWPEAREVQPAPKPQRDLPLSRDNAINSILQAPLPGMIGASRRMQAVYRAARLLARWDTTALITGPTGSGKELVARAIHNLSTRAGRNLVVVNCTAIPEPLLESELFGHARGAFTGAMQSYGGRIQLAQGGTLLLDEIGEMPLSMQPKLLRFLEQKEVQRLGSCDVVRLDTRVVVATNAHLPTLVSQGKFREDLYYRLCAFPIDLPPLRERPEDIAPLALHFLEKLSLRPPAPELSRDAVQLLKAQPWAGNVRELRNVIERALILAEDGAVIHPEHLRLPEQTAAACARASR